MEDGRQERFRALYLWARPRIVAYALRRARTAEDAADVLAETFAIAWRRFDELPAGEDALLWLYATAGNVLSNAARGERRRSNLVERIAATLDEDEILVASPDEGALLALVALRSLGKDDREVLMLTAWEGLDATGVGSVLGCSPGAARVRILRARRRLDGLIAALSSQGIPEKHGAFTGRKEGEGAAFGRPPEEA